MRVINAPGRHKLEPASAISVRPSPIQGTGVFAARSLMKGDAVLAIDDSRIVDDAHPLKSGEDPRHCDYLQGGKVILMQAPERYINHSCDPNTYVKTLNGERLVIARREIAPNEEITYDYSVNGGGNTIWTCSCGVTRCRRQIHSDFSHLPIELQKEYLSELDDWFREERAEEVERLEALASSERRKAAE